MYKDREYILSLFALLSMRSQKYLRLIDVFTSPENIWNAELLDLQAVIGPEPGKTLYMHCRKFNIEQYLEILNKKNIKTVIIDDDEYPVNLFNTYDPPTVLYYIGSLHSTDIDAVGIVGTRRPSPYGENYAKKIAGELASAGVAIVSGLARGIDAMAHYGCLEAGGRTLAVLGSGVDHCYPAENRKLYSRIADTGALISEYPPETKPIPANFPARNRIISGLSRGVLVVESKESGGSLITADFALEQGRDVFALPGNASSPNSIGTNRLIQQGARLVLSSRDILDDLGYIGELNDSVKIEQLSFSEHLLGNVLDKTIVGCLQDEKSFDELLQITQVSSADLQRCLLELELQGIVRLLPGNNYIAIL